jgi:hypothetical protein
MIANKNLNEFILQLDIPGVQSVANDQAANVVPCDGFLSALLVRLDTAPSAGGTQVTDVKLNGTSIFSGGTKVNFASGARVPTYGAFTTNPTPVSKGDTITLQTTTAGATVGKNLAVLITIRRGRADRMGTDTDSISTMSDFA